MKNIHVLPTDKPRFDKYLVLNKESKLCIWDTETMGSQRTRIPQNIYITSDEEIKEGEWCFDGSYLIQATPKLVDTQGLFDRRDWRKIILTTDQELIKDGVQKIDDEFLEWFVKNPSCDYVDLILLRKEGDNYEFLGYEIIIPEEEPKELQTLPYEYKLEDCLKETLEEADKWSLEKAQEFALNKFKEENISKKGTITWELVLEVLKVGVLTGHKFGAKWQAERMYSEEDLREAFRQGQDNMDYSDTYGWDSKLTEQEWFEQFKKK